MVWGWQTEKQSIPGSEVGTCLECSENRKDARVAGSEYTTLTDFQKENDFFFWYFMDSVYI